jgi:hypothetical protein
MIGPASYPGQVAEIHDKTPDEDGAFCPRANRFASIAMAIFLYDQMTLTIAYLYDDNISRNIRTVVIRGGSK